MSLVSRFMKEESGATAIEYALIAALIAVAAIVAMNRLGVQIRTTFFKAGNQLQSANAL